MLQLKRRHDQTQVTELTHPETLLHRRLQMGGPSLESRLQASGGPASLTTFQDELVTLLANMYPAWSVDEMVLHPYDAMQFCQAVRRWQTCSGLPDEMILRCLMHRRKNP
jgi:hypothetical protein